LSWYRFRALPRAVFAGLTAAQILACLQALASAWAYFFAPNWLLAFLGNELTRFFFFVLVSAYWLVFPLFSPRFSATIQKRSRLWPWFMTLLGAVIALVSFGFAESYSLANSSLAMSTIAVLRQILAGCASGFLLISAGFLTYRYWRQRYAMWAWLLFAALIWLFAVSLQYFQPDMKLLVNFMVALALALTMLALLADTARFLHLESEVRHSLLENVTQLESKAQNLAAVLSRSSSGVVHVDLDGRVTFANAKFAQLAGGEEEKLAGQPLKEILPQSLYETLVPALQEARRERSGVLEGNCVLSEQEIMLEVSHAPLFNTHGKVKELHLDVRDVTRYRSELGGLRKSLAEKSREANVLQQGFDGAVDALAFTNAKHEILYANEAFARSAGLARRDLLGKSIAQYRKPQDYPWPEIQKRLAQNLAWRGEVVGRGKDGRAVDNDVTIMPVVEDGVQHYFWIERDITALENRVTDRTRRLEHQVQQMTKLMEISENIRLNVDLGVIMQGVADAIHTLGWQRVAVFFAPEKEAFELAASAGFDVAGKGLPRKFRQLAYADFAPYMVDAFGLSSSFLIKSERIENKRPGFMPKELDVFAFNEWREHDCLLVPIRTREEYLGMIAVFCPKEGRYPEPQHVRELESYADAAALAIQNSRLLAAYAASERQARWLNQIGNTFRAVGTLERVLSEIAGIMAETQGQPVLLAMVMPKANSENGSAFAAAELEWRAASATSRQKAQPEARSLVTNAEQESILQNLFESVAETEMKDLAYAREKLLTLMRLPSARENQTTCFIKIFALRSREQRFGFVAWLMPEHAKPWSEEQSGFARDLVTQATLTIDNTRLFLQTEEKARALLRANQHTSEFLASVSHELRTPLHGILQFSELLLRGKLEERQKEHAQIVQRSGKSLLALINDILDLSKVEAGKMDVRWEEFELAELLRETLDTIQPLCDQKSLRLQRQLEAGLPRQFVSDRAILGRVLTNLLGNAVKFTNTGEIALTARVSGERAQIAVRDSGIGMPQNRLKDIFEPFRQLDSNEARKHGGTGLGLAISQSMMRILGGKIEVASTIGKGSTFTITLPLRVPVTLIKPVETKPAQAKAKTAGKASEKKTPNRDALILVIDDDATARKAMRFILEDEGYRAFFAENGEQALPMAQREQPDMILMDIMMPNLDGYQVARMLKNQKHLKGVPLVALTARAMKGDREKAFAAGCDDYLTKPFETKEILAMIEKWTG